MEWSNLGDKIRDVELGRIRIEMKIRITLEEELKTGISEIKEIYIRREDGQFSNGQNIIV